MPMPTLLLLNMLSRHRSDSCNVQLSKITVIPEGIRIASSMLQKDSLGLPVLGMVMLCVVLQALSTAFWILSVSVPLNCKGVIVPVMEEAAC